MAMTRKAPTVCMAATVQAARRVKNTTRSRGGLSPMERAWLSSKKVTMRSFQMKNITTSVTTEMMTSCSVSSGVTARMLPMTMVWMFTEVGDSEIMNRPRPKKAVKMSPMTASSLSLVRWVRNSMAPAARPPEKKAPSEKGRPSI
jgi:hypothetical protein